MNEITRIHLAKVPYEIEVPAKKILEKYLAELQDYAEVGNIVEDIEVRMTEILDERGVKAGGVIGKKDVETLMQQIGSLQEIAGESAVIEVSQTQRRKLYRDTDEAIVAGVASGLARYTQLDVTLVRILFVLLIVITSGAALIGYALLWVLMPEARTVADKLRMNGRAVTAEAIAETNTDVPAASRRRGEWVRRGLVYLGGTVAVIGATSTVLVLIAAAIGVYAEALRGQDSVPGVWYVGYGLAILSGLLLAALFSLVAYICFTRDLSKRVLVTVEVVVIAGLLSFGTAIGLGALGAQQQGTIQVGAEHQVINLPTDFKDIKSLSFETDVAAEIEYTVADEASASFDTAPGYDVRVDYEDGMAKFSVMGASEELNYMPLVVHVSGPTLASIELHGGSLSYIANSQEDLSIEQTDQTTVAVTGRVDRLEAKTANGSSLDFASASINHAKLDTAIGSQVELGNIGSLHINHSNVCPSGSEVTQIDVANVSADEININGQPRAAINYNLACLKLRYDQN